MRYRRARAAGATYFFTVVTAGRAPILTRPDTLDALRGTLRSVMRAHPFSLDAIAILPDHLHTLWTLPENDVDFSTRWMLVKSTVTRTLHAKGLQGTVWQGRFWEHEIRDGQDYSAHADYIHFNPVRHGLCSRASEWEWSSFRRWMERGLYPADWGQGEMAFPDEVGRE